MHQNQTKHRQVHQAVRPLELEGERRGKVKSHGGGDRRQDPEDPVTGINSSL